MQLLKLVIKNVGIIEDTEIKLDKPLLCFYGDIRQGKSTILKAVQWLLGAPWPSDIIRHGQKESLVQLEFQGGMISRSWYVTAKGETKARDLVFVRDGKPVQRPASEIARMLNPFQLNQNHLINMSETERKAFFAQLFAVDTTDLDREYYDNDRSASNMRIEIKGYGEIDTTKVEAVDVEPLKLELGNIRKAYALALHQHGQECDRIRAAHMAACELVTEENRGAIARKTERSQKQSRILELDGEIQKLEEQLANLRTRRANNEKWLKENPEIPEKPMPAEPKLPAAPTTPDTTALEQKIQDAGAINVRAEQYRQNVRRQAEKEGKEANLRGIEARQRAIKKDKVAKLKDLSEKSGIKGLVFAEDGTFTYDNTQAGMLSTSQLMQLSSELSALYPPGLGIELLDRGESLGKSIFGFVKRAQDENKTILAAIVGEKPAKVPENVGVFVVEQGKVTEAEEENFDIIP